MDVAKFGLIYYNAPGKNLEEFLDFAAEAGFSCAEINVQQLCGTRDPNVAAGVVSAELAARKGIQISAVAALNDFLVKSPEEMDQQVERMKGVCELAREIGRPILRMDGGWAKDGVPEEKWMDLMVEGFTRIADMVEAHDLWMALDNHGYVTNDADVQLEVFERVGSKRFGANLDTMNYRWVGHSVEKCREFYDKIAPHAIHVHFKDGRGSLKEYIGEALGEGEIDLHHAVAALKRANYDGVWLVEYEGRGDKAEGYKKGLAWLKQHVI